MVLSAYCVFFFFSSRRRHTRWTGDWSSDVCSSDLLAHLVARRAIRTDRRAHRHATMPHDLRGDEANAPDVCVAVLARERSEERRVGKECRSRWAREQEKKKDDAGTTGET